MVASCDVPAGTSRVVQDAVLAFTEDLERLGSGGTFGAEIAAASLLPDTIVEPRPSRPGPEGAVAAASRSGAAADAALDVRTVRGDDVSERKRDTASIFLLSLSRRAASRASSTSSAS